MTDVTPGAMTYVGRRRMSRPGVIYVGGAHLFLCG